MIVDKFSLKGKSGMITGRGTELGKSMATALVRAEAEV
jgi:hypothetical protein